MTNFEVGDYVKFAGGRGEITKIEERPNGGHLLNVYAPEGQLRKLPSGFPHIEKLDSLVDRLAAGQSDTPYSECKWYIYGRYSRFLGVNHLYRKAAQRQDVAFLEGWGCQKTELGHVDLRLVCRTADLQLQLLLHFLIRLQP